MPREESKWKSVSLPEDLIEQVENIREEQPELGYPSTASFISEAIRRLLKEHAPRFEHFNVYENHATVIDHKLGDRWIDIYFKNGKAWCEYCESFDCDHIQFILGKPDIRKKLKERGFKVS